jgi:hypothetical protein
MLATVLAKTLTGALRFSRDALRLIVPQAARRLARTDLLPAGGDSALPNSLLRAR